MGLRSKSLRMHCNPSTFQFDENKLFPWKYASVERVLTYIKANKVEAIMDTPVVHMFDEIRCEYQDAFVVLTTTNSLDWAKNRLAVHSHDPLYICAESSMPNRRVKQKDVLALQQPHLPHPFALQPCIARAIARKQTSPAVVELGDLKKAWINILGIEAGTEKTVKILSTSYQIYENFVRQRTPPNQLLEVNVWIDDACTIHDALENALAIKLPEAWRGKRFGTPVGARHGWSAACPQRLTSKIQTDFQRIGNSSSRYAQDSVKLYEKFSPNKLSSTASMLTASGSRIKKSGFHHLS